MIHPPLRPAAFCTKHLLETLHLSRSISEADTIICHAVDSECFGTVLSDLLHQQWVWAIVYQCYAGTRQGGLPVKCRVTLLLQRVQRVYELCIWVALLLQRVQMVHKLCISPATVWAGVPANSSLGVCRVCKRLGPLLWSLRGCVWCQFRFEPRTAGFSWQTPGAVTHPARPSN